MLAGLFAHHVSGRHRPASEERVQVAEDRCRRHRLMGLQPGPDGLEERLPPLFLGGDQAFLPAHLARASEASHPCGPMPEAGLVLLERHTPCPAKRGHQRADRLDGLRLLGQHHAVRSVSAHPVALPHGLGQSIHGQRRHQRPAHAARRGPGCRVGSGPLLPVAGWQPLLEPCPPWHRAAAVQENGLAEVVNGPVAVGLQAGWVPADGTVGKRHGDGRESLLTAASRATTSALRFAPGCQPGCHGVFAHPWPRPVAMGQEAQRPLRSRRLGKPDAPCGRGMPGVILAACIHQCRPRCRRGRTDPIHPGRLSPTVDLGDPSDRHQSVRVPAPEQCGQVPSLLPALRLGRSAEPTAPALAAPFRGGPIELGPVRGRTATGFRCLRRPYRADRVSHDLAFVSSSSTGGPSAPVPVGSLHLPWWPSPSSDRRAVACSPFLSPLGIGQRCRRLRQWPDHPWGFPGAARRSGRRRRGPRCPGGGTACRCADSRPAPPLHTPLW